MPVKHEARVTREPPDASADHPIPGRSTTTAAILPGCAACPAPSPRFPTIAPRLLKAGPELLKVALAMLKVPFWPLEVPSALLEVAF